MLTVQVSRWSQAAASLLPPQQDVVGWVHSCYARIINVRTPVGRLLTLQGEGMLQAPLGLALATDVAALGARLPVGALVVQDIPTARSTLRALRLRCADALVWDGQCGGAAWTDPVGAVQAERTSWPPGSAATPLGAVWRRCCWP